MNVVRNRSIPSVFGQYDFRITFLNFIFLFNILSVFFSLFSIMFFHILLIWNIEWLNSVIKSFIILLQNITKLFYLWSIVRHTAPHAYPIHFMHVNPWRTCCHISCISCISTLYRSIKLVWYIVRCLWLFVLGGWILNPDKNILELPSSILLHPMRDILDSLQNETTSQCWFFVFRFIRTSVTGKDPWLNFIACRF